MNRMAASRREMLPSSNTMPIISNEAKNANGMSFFTVDSMMIIGATIAATPTMSIELKMLLPTTLPTAKSGVPFRADTKLTQNSGAEVPSATTVKPITISETFSRWAMATAPSVMRSAPHSTSITPTTISSMFTQVCWGSSIPKIIINEYMFLIF